MASERKLSQDYDARFPEVDIPSGQKAERMERLYRKEGRPLRRSFLFRKLPLDENGKLRP